MMDQLFNSSKNNVNEFWSVAFNENDINGYYCLEHEFFPKQALNKFLLNLTFECPAKKGDIVISADPYYISINNNGQTCISRVFRNNIVAQSLELVLNANGDNVCMISYDNGSINLTLNGRTLEYKTGYCSFVSRLEIALPSKSQIRNLELSGQIEPLHLNSSAHIGLSTTIDFYDDILPEPYTEDMLQSSFKKMREVGIENVYWIHHGPQSSGFWGSAGDDFISGNIDRTFSNLGGNILQSACKQAHAYGLKLIAVIKPFDMNPLARTFPENSEQAQKYGKYSIVGGRAYCCFDYVAEHPEFCMQRKTKTNLKNACGPLQIILNFSKSIIPAVDVRLWKSDNNGTYSVYTGNVVITKKPGKIEVSCVDSSSKYLALELLSDSPFSHGNLLKDLIRINDSAGEPIPATIGLQPRETFSYNSDSNHLDAGTTTAFSKNGFDFDAFRHGLPSALMVGDAASNYFYEFTSERNFIGIALGFNTHIPGAMCPSEAGARKYWLELIEDAIRSGVDGVDIRVSSHIDILDWSQYGFNAAVLQEYKRLYGSGILEQEYDSEALRNLRGRFYTEFLKLAADHLRAEKKKLYVHIEDVMQGSADTSTMMEINWDWKKWIEEIKPDGVTFKAINADSYKTCFAVQVAQLCKIRKIPVEYCVFTHCIKSLETFIRGLAECGFSSVNLYEFASLYKAQKGHIVAIDKKLLTDLGNVNLSNV